LFISTVHLVGFIAYNVIISFTNCYTHIFSSSAASVFNKFSSAVGNINSPSKTQLINPNNATKTINIFTSTCSVHNNSITTSMCVVQ